MAVPARAPTEVLPFGRRFRGRLTPPPSKSVTNRVLTLALLAGRTTVVERPLRSEDTERMLSALSALGVAAHHGTDGEVRLVAGRRPASAAVDCGASGTMARFLTAALATLPGAWRLDGGDRLRERPLGGLIAALRRLGAAIDELGAPGRLPLEVRGGRLDGGLVEVDAGESSQVLSALLMAATCAAGPLEVRARRLVSSPYVDLTVEAMTACGAAVERLGADRWAVRPGLPGAERLAVEGDWSAAGYPCAAAALTGGEVELAGLRRDSAQGDRRLLELLETMGARVAWTGGGLRVGGGASLAAIDADLGDMPDQVPTVAVLAPFAAGTTTIRNVRHLRLKESDRIAALVGELRRCGVPAEATTDGLQVPGVWSDRRTPADEVIVDVHDDHRIAMSFAVLGLARPGVRLDRPGVVAKSYPEFWRDFEACTR